MKLTYNSCIVLNDGKMLIYIFEINVNYDSFSRKTCKMIGKNYLTLQLLVGVE